MTGAISSPKRLSSSRHSPDLEHHHLSPSDIQLERDPRNREDTEDMASSPEGAKDGPWTEETKQKFNRQVRPRGTREDPVCADFVRIANRKANSTILARRRRSGATGACIGITGTSRCVESTFSMSTGIFGLRVERKIGRERGELMVCLLGRTGIANRLGYVERSSRIGEDGLIC